MTQNNLNFMRDSLGLANRQCNQVWTAVSASRLCSLSLTRGFADSA